MTVEIQDNGNHIRLVVVKDGNKASTQIIGLSKSEVESRADEFISAHNLEEKALEK